MLHKIQITAEMILLGITIHWQPLFGILASVAAFWYYAAMLKLNVIDVRHEGSWRNYFRAIIKKFKP